MPGGRNKRGTPREVVLGGGHGPRRSTARVTPSGRQRNAPQWSTAAALAMDGALQMCVEREGGRRIAFIPALLCDRVPAGFFKRVRQLSSKRDEQRVRDIVASHRSRLPEGAALPLLTLEAKSLASTLAPYYRGVGSVEQLGVAPAPAEAGTPAAATPPGAAPRRLAAATGAFRVSSSHREQAAQRSRRSRLKTRPYYTPSRGS